MNIKQHHCIGNVHNNKRVYYCICNNNNIIYNNIYIIPTNQNKFIHLNLFSWCYTSLYNLKKKVLMIFFFGFSSHTVKTVNLE